MTTAILNQSDVIITDLNQVESIRSALSQQGFLALNNHNVDLELLDECYELASEFFSLNKELKNQYAFNKVKQSEFSNVGYYPMKQETALAANIADIKEFFHIAINQQVAMPWPAEVVNFKEKFARLFKQLEDCGREVTTAIAGAYDYDLEVFKNLISNNLSTTRVIHYPPVKSSEQGMRAAAHTGIQLLGVQPRTTHPGLQFCLPNGEWVELDSSFKDSLLINIGDMLSYLLGGKIQPTLHRVVNGGKELESVHRYCIVHFFHCDLAKQLQPLGNNEPIIAGDWLKDRLAKLGR